MHVLLVLGCVGGTAACTRTLENGASVREPPLGATGAELPAAASPTAVAPRLDCVDDARFVEDVTVPDGSLVAPGQVVDKRWEMENTGSCHWGPDYRLVPLGDNPLAAESEQALFPARAGARALWRVEFEAPEEPGEYIGQWVAVNPAGQSFGSPVFTVIIVEEGPLDGGSASEQTEGP